MQTFIVPVFTWATQ